MLYFSQGSTFPCTVWEFEMLTRAGVGVGIVCIHTVCIAPHRDKHTLLYKNLNFLRHAYYHTRVKMVIWAISWNLSTVISLLVSVCVCVLTWQTSTLQGLIISLPSSLSVLNFQAFSDSLSGNHHTKQTTLILSSVWQSPPNSIPSLAPLGIIIYVVSFPPSMFTLYPY